MKKLKDLKRGEFFKLKDSPTSPMWVRSEYCRSERKYSCYKYDDVNHESFFKGDRIVFTDFYF